MNTLKNASKTKNSHHSSASQSIKFSEMKPLMPLISVNSTKLKDLSLTRISTLETSWQLLEHSSQKWECHKSNSSHVITLTQSHQWKFSVIMMDFKNGLKLETLVFSDLKCLGQWVLMKTLLLLRGV